MSTFGDNIFDDEPVRPRPAERVPPRQEAPAPAPQREARREPADRKPEPRQERGEPRQRDDRGHEPRRDHHRHRHEARDAREPREQREQREPRGGHERRERDEHRGPKEPQPPREEHRRPPRTPRPDAPAVEDPTPGGAVTILVELGELEADARNHGGEVLYKRLLSSLGNGREVRKAICIAGPASRTPAGFEVQANDGGAATGVRFAAAAVEASTRGPVVLAPASPAIVELAAALARRGAAVEVAGFSLTGEVPGARRLGRESLFIP